MESSDAIHKIINPSYECDICRCRLEEGDFIAIIGKTPPTGLSIPLGRGDTILKNVGKIYCEKCFRKQ
jgi:hypothetical protein